MGRYIVTGGSGFIGSHLCDRLIAEGHEVVAIDNLCTGDLGNLADALRSPRFDLLQLDVSDPLDIPGPIDGVYHLASPASPKDFERLQVEILAVNADGTRRCLELARYRGARFVLASTSEVYGDPEVHPQVESYLGNVDSLTIRGVYDESKRFAETAVMTWRRAFGVDGRIARIFNTYGPRMRLDDGRVLPNFISQVVRGQPLTLYGDGSQTRSFCYVDDLVDGLCRIMNHDGISLPINLGNPDEVTIEELADEVIALSGRDIDKVREPLPIGDPKVRRPDTRRAKDLLGWVARIPRAEGLRQAYADMAPRVSS
jgi:dTDP-glucose 4,6-dehydratase